MLFVPVDLQPDAAPLSLPRLQPRTHRPDEDRCLQQQSPTRAGGCRQSRHHADQCSVRRFADMEIFVEIHENIRGEDVFVIQSTAYPANDHLMELLITLDALRRSSARRVTAVVPYFGYARQDRKSGPRTPISAKLVANLITQAGADRVLTLDLHAGQIQGFFDIRWTTCTPRRCSRATSRSATPGAS
jgi:ribose-phosphate pyrophosphokinase